MKKCNLEKKQKKEADNIYPHNKTGNEVDESFRIDDNANLSTTALAENQSIDAPDVPGVGLESEEL